MQRPPTPVASADAASAPVRVRFDVYELDERNARLTRDGVPVGIAPRAFAVLCALARHPGMLVTKEALLDAVWGHRFVTESVLKTAVSELRIALGDDARAPRYLETVARHGYRFIGRAAPSPPVPGGTSPLDGSRTAPVGRERSLHELHAAWARAAGGTRQLCWVAGDAGVGKTTLVDHFVDSLPDVRVVRGQCVEPYGAGEPYLPVLEALAELARAEPAVEPLLRRVAPTWLLQLPWLLSTDERDALRRELAASTQERMLREFGQFLEQVASDHPLVLVTEDLHWSDQATVRLLDHVARRRSPARVLWIATFRLAEVVAEEHPLNAVRHELRVHRLCTELVLETLSEQQTAELIARRVPSADVPESFTRALHAHTDGLPLFLVAVLDELLAGQDAQSAWASITADALGVPESLAGIVGRRYAQCDDDTRAVLDAASVCGDEFRVAVVAALVAREPAAVEAICEASARHGRWLEPPTVAAGPSGGLDVRVAFRHALYRHVIYQRLGAPRRAQLHRDLAHRLDRERAAGADIAAAELATHYARGHEPLAAMRCYAEAAERAMRHFAPADAMAVASQALELVPQSAAGATRDAVELALVALRGAATAQLVGISSLDARRDFDRARALLAQVPTHPLRALVLHGLGLVLMTRGEYAAAIEIGQQTHALAEPSDDLPLLLSACSVLGQVHAMQGRHRDALTWLDRGIVACERLDDGALRDAFVVDPSVTLYAASVIPLLHLGYVDRARARCRHARARAHALGEPMAQMVANWFGAVFHVRVLEPETVAELGEEMRLTVERAALAQGRAAQRWFRGWAAAHAGRPAEACTTIREALDESRRVGMLSGATEVMSYAAEACLLAGDADGARAELDAAFALAERIGERVAVPALELLAARVADAYGDAGAAHAARERARAEARNQGAVWMELLAVEAACAADGTATHGAPLADVLARLPEGADTGPVRTARARLAAAEGRGSA